MGSHWDHISETLTFESSRQHRGKSVEILFADCRQCSCEAAWESSVYTAAGWGRCFESTFPLSLNIDCQCDKATFF